MIHALYGQRPGGAFPSHVAGLRDETCFVTAGVALLLDLHTRRAAIERALDFIEGCEFPGVPGAFTFYPAHAGTPRLVDDLPPDADDTALAWMALLRGGRRRSDAARRAFDRWITPAARLQVPGGSPPWVRPGAVRTWLVEQGRDNPVDLTVNANVAAWAALVGRADHPAAAGAAATLVAAARGGYCPRRFARRLSPYYADITELYLACRRAYHFGVHRLVPVLEWLKPVCTSDLARRDKPLYCNAHGQPVWYSPALQAARSRYATELSMTDDHISRIAS